MACPIQIRFAEPTSTDRELWCLTRGRVPGLREDGIHLKLSYVWVSPIIHGYMRRVHVAFMHLVDWKDEGKLIHHEHIPEGLLSFPRVFEMLFPDENTGKLPIKA